MLAIWIQYFLPQRILSSCLAAFANCRIGWVKNAIINCFASYYRVDMQDARLTNLSDYPSFNAFFTRALRADARPVCLLPQQYAMPADGKLVAAGSWQQNAPNLLIKNHRQSLVGLMAESALPESWTNGSYAVVYLSPRDYHRVHMPFDGSLLSMTFVPGRLFSVNESTVAAIPDLFSLNERLICRFATEQGELIVIWVGAMIVGSMVTRWCGVVAPGSSQPQTFDYAHQPLLFRKGEELGYFQLGSTVVVLTPGVELSLGAAVGQEVKMGQCLWGLSDKA